MIYVADKEFETHQQAFEWCKQNGSENDWIVLAMAYYNNGYYLNALFCFKQADNVRRQEMLQLIGEVTTPRSA